MNPIPHPNHAQDPTIHPAAPPPPPPWVPPGETEQLLHEATLRGDARAQLAALAGAELYIPAPRAEVDARPDTITWRAHHDPSGFVCRPVLTRGMLPAWHPDWVFHGVTLRWVAEFSGWPEAGMFLGVNVGTPGQLLLPATPTERALWQRAYAENDRLQENRLLALRHGALHGPLAYGLACGAHLAIVAAVPWNEVGTVYREYERERAQLRDSWGITDHAGWRGQLDILLDARNSPPEPDFVLRAREQLAAGLGELPSADLWRETAAGHAQDLGADAGTVKGIEDLVRRIMRYEARFRADGLLEPDGRVRTTVAYDYGRAVNLARWGLSARYCAPADAEQAIVYAGALSKSAHRSWEEFSAGYALGRVLRFDGEAYGPFYEQNVIAHRLLAESEGSPWRHIPWR